ncbi:GlxA family transcriptional regulator [Pleionea sp. CnH1-48]|uniref:GlxA family transcriptional regulator n=1 Tax=Pleionea sp. CnH1-48 TaxID=2954494 RepID=UPI0020975D78|nr:helix-turn-helix domain-containing protein [Pleionea sp. CnH1-48]MCO7224587.1 DJ-1/PfpI family protein [Pleionea sp. CnH1-48]
MSTPTPHTIAFIGFDKVQLLDFAGPLECFHIANEILQYDHYHTSVIAESSRFKTESYVTISADALLAEAESFDTLVIPGGEGSRIKEIAAPIQEWLNHHINQCGRVLSVCTGIFLLAHHSYLHHKEVVTHWAFAEQLQQNYPLLKVNHERLFIKQENFYSAAGILSGIDLALHVIEEDHGVDVAAHVAKYLVTYLKRSGYQSQFSQPLQLQSANNSHLKRANDWINANIHNPITVTELAEAVHLSERHLNRLIQQHYFMGTAAYIEHLKLEQSKVLLSYSQHNIDVIAKEVGYASAASFRRGFKRKYGIAPQSYQKRFA